MVQLIEQISSLQVQNQRLNENMVLKENQNHELKSTISELN
jgi:hypothetical protein